MKAKRIILAICVLFNTCLGLAASDIHAEEDQVGLSNSRGTYRY